ncbi:hypothetical protein AB1Y20_014463 [Prymnesium parvum]|uniref:Uncharacterized protein n=1 Tax=Prymnesium parvum TaxID=97485 RepID=A0AB34IGE7_PRYPA
MEGELSREPISRELPREGHRCSSFGTRRQEMLRAAQNGDVRELRRLLRNNANIEERNNDGASPLHLAAMNGHEGAVRLLLEKNANIAVRENFGCSPLHMAAMNGHEVIVRLLLENNADIAARDNEDGYSPLHCAASFGHESAVRLLLENNADIAAREMVRMCACGWRRECVAMGVALTPLTPRPPLSSPWRQFGRSPLHLAAMNGHEDAVRLLLEKNADIAARNIVRVCACGWTRERVAMGAALTPLTPRLPLPSSPRRQDGASPLHLAAENGHEDAVGLLLENNADIAASTKVRVCRQLS